MEEDKTNESFDKTINEIVKTNLKLNKIIGFSDKIKRQIKRKKEKTIKEVNEIMAGIKTKNDNYLSDLFMLNSLEGVNREIFISMIQQREERYRESEIYMKHFMKESERYVKELYVSMIQKFGLPKIIALEITDYIRLG